MPSVGHTLRYVLHLSTLLIVLAVGAAPARAQRVPLISTPAEPGYVSLSGALTFGFSAVLKDSPVDPIGMVPPESEIPGLCRNLFNEMWLGSTTFRRQWTRLAGARIRVTIVLGPPSPGGPARAQAELARTPDLRVRIWLPLVDSAAVEYLAHEIEHVLEALDDVDLPVAVEQGVHGATGLGRPRVFETRRAIAIGRMVAHEVDSYRARR
jgi:hypothetical protein